MLDRRARSVTGISVDANDKIYAWLCLRCSSGISHRLRCGFSGLHRCIGRRHGGQCWRFSRLDRRRRCGHSRQGRGEPRQCRGRHDRELIIHQERSMSLQDRFDQAKADSKNLPERPDNMTLLKFMHCSSRHLRATQREIVRDSPTWWDVPSMTPGMHSAACRRTTRCNSTSI
jgi:hypothetical protein